MNDRQAMEKTIQLLKVHYYGSILLLAVIFVLTLFSPVPFFTEGQAISVTAERYAIMITIIAIPAALKFFAYRLKKISRPAPTAKATDEYKKASFLRLYIISAVTLINIFLFAISRNMNFFWFTVVLFIVFLFCKPSYPELEILTQTPEEKGSTEEDESEPEKENQSEEGPSETGQEEKGSGEIKGQYPEDIQNNHEAIAYNYPENE